jgi:3-oxoacyl-[acyl-carrier protein] reductase
MDKVAIVTGGTRGIGRAIVEKLAKNGYKVVLDYNKSIELAKRIQDEYREKNIDIDIFQADVSSEAQVKKLVDFTLEKHNKIDLLINNAGIDFVKLFTDITVEEYDKVMDVNLKSAFLMSKYVAKSMIEQKSGHIINISSIWGIEGASCESIYAVSKAGMDGLTKSLAKELAPSNIRVNSIAPGLIDTDMNKNILESDLRDIIKEIPIGRIGKPEDVADAVMLLDNCGYITGQVMQVNGGWNI